MTVLRSAAALAVAAGLGIHAAYSVGSVGARPERGPSASGDAAASPSLPASGHGLAGPTDADTSGEAPRARRLIRRAAERYRQLRSLRAHFRDTSEVPLLDRRRSGEGTWYQKGRGRFKMDYEEPPRDVIVADGSYLWLYYPSTHPGQVVRTRIESHPTGTQMVDLQGRIFREARQGYDARYGGTREVLGRSTHLVVLTPTGPSPYRKVRVWIDATNDLVRKFEITEDNKVRTVVLTDPEPDVAIPDSVFSFEVPEGVEVFSG